MVKEKSFIHLMSYPKIEKKILNPKPSHDYLEWIGECFDNCGKCVLSYYKISMDKHFCGWEVYCKDGSMAFHLWISGLKSSVLILSLQYSVIFP